MKQVITIFFIFILYSCTCDNLQKRSSYVNQSYLDVFIKNKTTFNEISLLLDSIIVIHKNSSLPEISYGISIESLNNGKITKKSDKKIHDLLSRIACNDLFIDLRYKPNVLVRFYPNNTDKYNSKNICPNISVQLLYTRHYKELSIHESPNFNFYKLSSFWFVQTSIPSL